VKIVDLPEDPLRAAQVFHGFLKIRSAGQWLEQVAQALDADPGLVDPSLLSF